MSPDEEDEYIRRAAAENDGWPVGADADRDDPLTALRIAVTSSHPGWAFLVAFDRESEARPTDAEAAMLRSYLDEYKAHWYNPSYLAKLDRRLLDVDGGANGVVFHKFGPDDWGYRRRSFTVGYLFTVVWPSQRAEYQYHKWCGPFSLLALMDGIHTFLDEPMKRWVDWKAARPGVFGESVRAEQ
jgi:hypothetical protein